MHCLNLKTCLGVDAAGNQYVNLDVADSALILYLEWMRRNLPPEIFSKYVENQQIRDRGFHHLTVVNPIEYKKFSDDQISRILSYPVFVKLLGVGSIKEAGNEVYFVVCQSEEVQNIRKLLDLPRADLHITLGFAVHDIFDKPKDVSALVDPYSFISLNS